MHSVKIVHCADIHLNSSQKETGEAFLRLLRFCNKEKVDFLLIAGDLFEEIVPNDKLLQWVIAGLQSLERTKVIYVTGNHDYQMKYMKNQLPNHVYMLSEQMQVLDFEKEKVCIYGAGFSSVYETQTLIKPVVLDDSYINIGVFHGELVTDGGQSNYHPIPLSVIRDSGFDYVALGHIHKRSEIQQAGITFYAYSGCLCGRGFDETDEKGFYYGLLGKEFCDLEFVAIDQPVYRIIEVDVTDVLSVEQLASEIKDTIEVVENGKLQYQIRNFYRVVLIGHIQENVFSELNNLEWYFEDFRFLQVQDCTVTEIDYDKVYVEDTMKGIFVRRMYEKINEAEEQEDYEHASILQEALKLGITALEGGVKL